jgi:hypothetical protein
LSHRNEQTKENKMIDSKQVIQTVEANGVKFEIVRVRSYGFRCNSLETDWEIHKNGQLLCCRTRLRDAKKELAELAA